MHQRPEKQKVVSAQSLTESLTTFGDLYREALPEERRELIQLRVNQLIWIPDEIRLALLDQPEPYPELGESQHLVARRPDSSNFGVVWDKFHVHQVHRAGAPRIAIGRRRQPNRLKVPEYRNPLKRALHYRELLDSGLADTQQQLAQLTATPRPTIAAYLRLLSLDEQIQSQALSVSDLDGRMAALTLSRLRRLLRVSDPAEQRRQFFRILGAEEPEDLGGKTP